MYDTQISFFSFDNSATFELDLTDKIFPDKSYLLSMVHNGWNNHTTLYFISCFVNPEFPSIKEISALGDRLIENISVPRKNVILFDCGSIRNYSGYFFLHAI